MCPMFPEMWKRGRGERGVTLMAALFFIVIIALFGLLAVRFISMGQIGSGEAYRYSQARFAALAGRELHFLYLDTGGTYGWDGAAPVRLTVGRCRVERTFGDVNATLDEDAVIFRLRGSCGGASEGVARVWEAAFHK